MGKQADQYTFLSLIASLTSANSTAYAEVIKRMEAEYVTDLMDKYPEFKDLCDIIKFHPHQLPLKLPQIAILKKIHAQIN